MRARQAPTDRAGFWQATGALLVFRDPPPPPTPAPGQPPMVSANPAEGPEILLAVWDDGTVNGLCGKVDLGTGIATALGQLVAEELGVPFDRVVMLLGDTARAPNQGPTIASATLQIASDPLKRAAAQARAWLEQQGLTTNEASQSANIARLLQGRQVHLSLDLQANLKPAAQWQVVGQSVPRVDIPAKVLGEATFVHDVRLPGMLHGRVVRPPYAGTDQGDFIGRTLRGVDESSIAHLPGIVALVREGDFVGIVAEREEQAEAAMRNLRLDWGDWPAQPPLNDLAQALSAHPATPRVVAESGDVATANADAPLRLQRRYVWPYQMHASIGPSCAVAHWQDGALKVWSGTQNPHVLRADLALLTGLTDTAVEVVRLEAAGCYGRNGADDVTADAALLSRAVGKPVRVQLTREQEHQWEPKGAAQLMDVDGSVSGDGQLLGWDFQTCYPSNAAPTLALLLTGRVAATAQAFAMGDRTSVPPYRVPHLKVTVNDMPPILRASWLRGVSALPNSFAHESFIDELAHAQREDPLAFRLKHLDDVRAAELLRAVAQRAGWQPHVEPRQHSDDGVVLKGQGLAYARYIHSKFPGFGAAWSAWVADVEVNRITGEVHVSRVVVGHDAGAMVNPAGVQHQVHGNVVQTTSRALKEQVSVAPSTGAVTNREWGSYPLLSFREVPIIEVVMMPRPGEPMLGAGESSSVPGTAAIANAIFDATGIRFRQPPFTPEVVRAALNPLPGPGAATAQPTGAGSAPPLVLQPPPQGPVSEVQTLAPLRKQTWARIAALATGVLACVAGWVGLYSGRQAIAPISRVDASVYTVATLERGRHLAALGNCIGCHTKEDGTAYAGGRPIETPFGVVYATNLTPDPETGIGRWSFSAFQRAMREGVSQNGHHLYPAFPYTAFTRMEDDELTALYAYLLSLNPVRQATPAAELRAPFSWRPLMALWNALYLQPGPTRAAAAALAVLPASVDVSRWQRGEYLVNGPGHCGACHTPRDALGAERGGSAYLSGAWVDGWHAPSLTATNRHTLPWSESHLYSYLKHGHSAAHGVAVGPMAQVVTSLSAAPDEDLRAMAHYLSTFQGFTVAQPAAETPRARPDPSLMTERAHQAVARARALAPLPDNAQRLFEGACGACHGEGSVPVDLGLNLPLALNSKLLAQQPDNLLHVLLDGIQRPATPDIAFMPGFRHAMDDAQLTSLASWLRQRYAPDMPPWPDALLRQRVAAVRGAPHTDR
ncbi:MAG: aldehyde dehydrogenase [Betaproteobacteria bacterium]|nr:aldehyde dehydrogenase [Betaproteobacteria bacterium]NBP38240.1 aldehyde dehydrogenase [Betaproteobacteria bacterium]NBQ79375.1 aldehyde dehydrogenase [Betaproteobacteria bacterium]NBT82283.1 aldehyde dehydrogenase [Betaproteobacteria bacterium]NCV14346.1 aldehyde dehydrogenase [Betaproteobacteria bacterium]